MKRLALITVILGSALALVPFASAMARSEGSGGIDFRATHSANPATQAVLLRSEGLSNYYATTNGVTFHTDTLGGKGAPDSLPAATDNTFDWGNALAVTLAAMLILGIAAMTRARHRLSY